MPSVSAQRRPGPGFRRLGMPRRIAVATGEDGVPVRIGGEPVTAVLDEWRVEEGWWTRRPLRRRYFELVLADGRNAIVFCDPRSARWYAQRP